PDLAPERGVERTIARARSIGIEGGAGGGLDRLGRQHQRVLLFVVRKGAVASALNNDSWARLGRRGPSPVTACSARNRLGGATLPIGLLDQVRHLRPVGRAIDPDADPAPRAHVRTPDDSP